MIADGRSTPIQAHESECSLLTRLLFIFLDIAAACGELTAVFPDRRLGLLEGSSFDLLISAKMTVRALYFWVLGFAGLFAIQGCGGDEAAAETTAAAEGTTASP